MRRVLSFTVVTRVLGVPYIVYMLLSSGTPFLRLLLGAVATMIVITCDRERWRPFALFASPFLLQLLVYDRQRLLAPKTVDVKGPRDWELAWFGIRTSHGVVTPAEWLQSHTSVVLDVVCGLVYLGFMIGFIALAAWWRFKERREEAQIIMWALLTLHVIGYTIHHIHPTAPPWYVDHYGTGPAVLNAPPEPAGGARFDHALGVTWFTSQYKDSAEVFGAMPSLHVGQTFMAALFAWRYRSLRVVATTFFALVFLSSVYLDHHYIVDGVVGIAIAGVVYIAAVFLLRRTSLGTRPPVKSDAGVDEPTTDDRVDAASDAASTT